MNKKDLKELSIEALTDEILSLGEAKYRARQVYEWLHINMARSTDDMSNIPKSLRSRLDEEYELTFLKTERKQESRLDGTKKYLFRLADDNLIEAVFMKYEHGNSLCISSQAGCRMGCRFCASGLLGLSRNLTAAEMLDEVYAATCDTGERISNVVVMGTGEPLDNLNNLLMFIELVSRADGYNMSKRNITVSTCGLVPEIYELAKHRLPVTLALSLHAADDEKRKRLMPIANKYSIDELMEALIYYFDKTGRRVSLEYALIAGENDSKEDAERLTALAKRGSFHINLIPVNPVTENNYRTPPRAAVAAFKNRLMKNGVNVTVRRTLGADIDGACGQLRNKASL